MTITTMIEQSVLISLIVLLIWYTMQDGEIFGWLGDWFHDHLPTSIHSPVFDCPICMTPWYGSLLYWIFFHANVMSCILVVLSAAGLNILYSRIKKEENAD